MEQLNENQLKVKRAEAVMQIGEFYYKKFREQSATPDADVEKLVTMVAELDLQIARVTGAWMEQEGVCPSCGGQVGENTAFCPNCGYSMKEYRNSSSELVTVVMQKYVKNKNSVMYVEFF